MASSAEPVVRDADHGDVVAICRFGEAHIRPHYAPLTGAAAADEQVRRWSNETHIGAAVAEGRVVVAEADGQLVGLGQRGRSGADHLVYKLYLHPRYRGRGLGPQLLDALTRQLPANADRIDPSPTGDPALGVGWRARPWRHPPLPRPSSAPLPSDLPDEPISWERDPMSAALRGATRLPDGTMVRGRSLRDRLPEGPQPDYGLYLVSRPGHQPGTTSPQHPGWIRLRRRGRFQPRWEADWIVWPDFRVPADPQRAAHAIVKAFRRAQAGGRVEVACRGGSGRTGTVLACMAILAGVPATQAVGWVRANYRTRAVETRSQRRWVEWFALQDPGGDAQPDDPTGTS